MVEKFKDMDYAVKIGRIRVLKLAEEYEKLGYLVITNPENHEGADLIIISLPDGRIRKVIEATNYREPTFHMDNERVERYIGTLTMFEGIDSIELELIVSFLDNLSASQLLDLKKANIKVRVIGHQDLDNNTEQGWVDQNEH